MNLPSLTFPYTHQSPVARNTVFLHKPQHAILENITVGFFPEEMLSERFLIFLLNK